ncbi:hypothetical protein CYMTET_48702 [Cymbomonas tetramitiformis]|uniref:Uncharacterized protein n=1 Tax=Cymbomonas tetramitiformis TaxID=36881 RepID=A0AAE0BRP4_9CHLO|nr:hypothetical protein CYMTET_48702 [Cymbomonas tetramitiformis]
MSAEPSDVQIEAAEQLVQESQALNAAVSEKLASASPAEITMSTSVAAPAAAASVPAAAAAAAAPASMPMSKAPAANPDLILGLSKENWGIILGLFAVFYISLAMIYWSVLEIGVTIRGSDYLSLPSNYYGDYSRDFYYKGFGAPVDKQIELLPWVKAAVCPSNTNYYVCTPSCDDLFVTPPSKDDSGKLIENDNCNKECGVQCFNP